MTDAVTPRIVRNSGLPRPNFPVLRIAASLAAISALVGDAFKMAYVDAYTPRPRRPHAVREDDLDGRDPDW